MEKIGNQSLEKELLYKGRGVHDFYKEKTILHKLENANSLHDVCLQWEHNQNPLYDIDFEDGFSVTYEDKILEEQAKSISYNLREVADTIENLSNQFSEPSSTPKVIIPKEVDLTFNF